MIKELLAIFKKDTMLDRAYQRSNEMLEITRNMFLKAKKSLREKDTNQLDIDIYNQDIEVNRYEREVRRNVFNHLAISGTEDIYSGLVLVSIIIDIERIGDYTKNIVELALNYPPRLQGGKFEEDLKKIEAAVEDQFLRVPKVFRNSDIAEAEKILEEYIWVNPLCDKRVISYIKEEDSDMTSGNAVAVAMYFRYLKRVNSHLRNIVTSVVNPFDKIGFTPSRFKKKDKPA